MTPTYFNVIANNSVGVLNRITSLLRRRNYNIGDLNLSFDNQGFAHMLIWIDTKKIDAEQIANQLLSLYDIREVEIITDMNRIKKVFYVSAGDKEIFSSFPSYPNLIIDKGEEFVGIYTIDFEKASDFVKELQKSGLSYLEKSI